MTDNICLRHKLFAKFMAAEDQASHEQYKVRKERLFSGLHGRVLELGPGTGVNFPFFAKDIEWVGVEPNPAMHPFLREKAESFGIGVTLSENLEMESESFDFAISTLVLCSVPDVDSIISDIHRLLKPGGKFLFIEHVVDKERAYRRVVQKVVPFTPWRYFSDGCFPARDLAANITSAGFSTVDLENYLQDGQGAVNWVNKPHIAGVARKG